MPADTQLADRFTTMMRELPVPPVQRHAIYARVTTPGESARTHAQSTLVKSALASAAMLAVCAAVFPSTSIAVVRTVEERLRELALGYPMPPTPPPALVRELRARNMPFNEARAQVPFTLLAPTGVPADASQPRISVDQAAEYSQITRAWSTSTNTVAFTYHRRDGRSFVLIAQRYDPQSGPQPKYIIDADASGEVHGRLHIVKHEHFAWRNGNQMMGVTADAGITATEINRIRIAMGGTELPRTESSKQQHGPLKLIRLPEPR